MKKSHFFAECCFTRRQNLDGAVLRVSVYAEFKFYLYIAIVAAPRILTL